jgi:hypothetical protein
MLKRALQAKQTLNEVITQASRAPPARDSGHLQPTKTETGGKQRLLANFPTAPLIVQSSGGIPVHTQQQSRAAQSQNAQHSPGPLTNPLRLSLPSRLFSHPTSGLPLNNNHPNLRLLRLAILNQPFTSTVTLVSSLRLKFHPKPRNHSKTGPVFRPIRTEMDRKKIYLWHKNVSGGGTMDLRCLLMCIALSKANFHGQSSLQPSTSTTARSSITILTKTANNTRTNRAGLSVAVPQSNPV